jgi:hypothetical protein
MISISMIPVVSAACGGCDSNLPVVYSLPGAVYAPGRSRYDIYIKQYIERAEDSTEVYPGIYGNYPSAS